MWNVLTGPDCLVGVGDGVGFLVFFGVAFGVGFFDVKSVTHFGWPFWPQPAWPTPYCLPFAQAPSASVSTIMTMVNRFIALLPLSQNGGSSLRTSRDTRSRHEGRSARRRVRRELRLGRDPRSEEHTSELQ